MRLDNLSKADLAIVSNRRAMIDVNQQWAGYGGDMLNFSDALVLPLNVTKSNYSRVPTNSVWWKSAAVVLYASNAAATISFRLDELTWGGVNALGEGAHDCDALDLWAVPGSAEEQLGPVSGEVSAEVPAGDVKFLRIGNCTSSTTEERSRG